MYYSSFEEDVPVATTYSNVFSCHPPVKVQATCLQDVELGREAAKGVAHARQSATFRRVREQRASGEGLEDVHEGTGSELPLSGDERDAADDSGGREEAK